MGTLSRERINRQHRPSLLGLRREGGTGLSRTGLSGGSLAYRFDRAREHADRRRGVAFKRLSHATSYTVHLEPLPCWAHLSSAEYQHRVAEIVDDIESQ